MGPRPQCYILRPKVTGPLVPEKMFEGFLPYMGVAATLVMWLRGPEQTFVSSTHGGFTWNLASIGPAVLEQKIFENGGQATTDNGRTTEHAYTKLTNEPKSKGELKTTFWTMAGQAKNKASSPNPLLKAIRRGRHWVWGPNHCREITE